MLSRIIITTPFAMEPAPKRSRQSGSRVTLNVGSVRFETTLETLRGYPNSFFGALTSGRHLVNWEENGSIFIVRSASQFSYILQYLRNGSKGIVAPESLADQDELLLEAEYYGLTELAAHMRRFRLLDSHFITVDRLSPRVKTRFAVISGLRHAAALFDVQDPDNFEITFFGRSRAGRVGDDWGDPFLGRPNGTVFFIGVAPLGTSLSNEWISGPNPLPVYEPSPFHDASYRWSNRGPNFAPAGPVPRAEATRLWPEHVFFPPALQDGFFCALTVCKFGVQDEDEDYAADGFLTQFISKGDFVAADKPRSTLWTKRVLDTVSMRFARSSEASTLEMRLANDDEGSWNKEFNLAAEGLDVSLPYRPVIFFGKKAFVEIDSHFAS